MSAVRDWLCAVVMTAALVSLLKTLAIASALRRAISFAGSLTLILVVLKPVSEINLTELKPSFSGYGEELSHQEALARERRAAELGRLVAERTETLIRERTAVLGGTVHAEVSVREREGIPIPWAVALRGDRVPGLQEWIDTELGIPPERQSWMDAP